MDKSPETEAYKAWSKRVRRSAQDQLLAYRQARLARRAGASAAAADAASPGAGRAQPMAVSRQMAALVATSAAAAAAGRQTAALHAPEAAPDPADAAPAIADAAAPFAVEAEPADVAAAPEIAMVDAAEDPIAVEDATPDMPEPAMDEAGFDEPPMSFEDDSDAASGPDPVGEDLSELGGDPVLDDPAEASIDDDSAALTDEPEPAGELEIDSIDQPLPVAALDAVDDPQTLAAEADTAALADAPGLVGEIDLAASDLNRLPGAGVGLVWLLSQCGIRSLADLAAADGPELSRELGLIGQLVDVDSWIAFAADEVAAA